MKHRKHACYCGFPYRVKLLRNWLKLNDLVLGTKCCSKHEVNESNVLILDIQEEFYKVMKN